MTEALERLSTVLTTAPPEATTALLLTGTVVQISPVIRVDVGAQQLSCIELTGAGAIVGQTVYVIQSGGLNLILGTSGTDQIRKAPASFTTDGSGNAGLTFSSPFPTACDGVIWQHGTNPISLAFILSTAAGSFVVGFRNPSTGAAIAATVFTGWYWAWGH